MRGRTIIPCISSSLSWSLLSFCSAFDMRAEGALAFGAVSLFSAIVTGWMSNALLGDGVLREQLEECEEGIFRG